MNLKVTITNRDFRPHRSKSGRDVGFQKAMFFRGDGAAFPIDLIIDPLHPYEPGDYDVLPDSYRPGRYGDLEFRPVLKAVAAAKPAPVAKVG